MSLNFANITAFIITLKSETVECVWHHVYTLF